MSSLSMQPTFTLDVPLPPDEVIRRIREAIRARNSGGNVTSAGACVDFKVPQEQQRFWSPHLNVHVSDQAGGSELFCRFSPRPEVWTMVMAIYFAGSFFIFSAAIYGYVQWELGAAPWALIFIPIGLTMIGVLHLASLIGQRLSADQMQDLRTRLDELMREAMGEKKREE